MQRKYGAALYFAGQETGYEHWTDEQHLACCFRNLALIPGFKHLDRRGMLHYRILRHRSADKGYFLTEPGVQQFRPHARTSIENLWLAGDWVRSELDFPCMESAVRSGLVAADLVDSTECHLECRSSCGSAPRSCLEDRNAAELDYAASRHS